MTRQIDFRLDLTVCDWSIVFLRYRFGNLGDFVWDSGTTSTNGQRALKGVHWYCAKIVMVLYNLRQHEDKGVRIIAKTVAHTLRAIDSSI